jgi:hypothetical protein
LLLVSVELDVELEELESLDDELDESELPGGGPEGGPPMGGAPLAPSGGPAFSRKDDSSDLETLPFPSPSIFVNNSSNDDVLLVVDVPSPVEVLPETA